MGPERKTRLIMILQVLADAGQIQLHLDAVLRQLAGGTDAGGQQQHRRVDGAAGQDQFAPRADALDFSVALDLDANSAASLEQDFPDMGSGHQFQVFPGKVRPEVADRGRAAPAIVDVERRKADAVDAFAVEIRVALVLQALAGLDKGLRHRRGPLDVGDRHRAAGAAPLIRAVDAMLHPLEVGQHVLVAPAPRAEPLPLVIVARRAAQEHQPVDRARSAHHLAARPDDAAAAQPRLRLGLVTPVDVGIGHELAEPPGNMDPGIAVAPAGLDHAERNPGVFRQPRRQHASGRSGAGHHDVEFHIEPGFCHDCPSARICAWGLRYLPAKMLSLYRIFPTLSASEH